VTLKAGTTVGGEEIATGSHTTELPWSAITSIPETVPVVDSPCAAGQVPVHGVAQWECGAASNVLGFDSAVRSAVMSSPIDLAQGSTLNGASISAGPVSSPWQSSGLDLYYAAGKVGVGAAPRSYAVDVVSADENVAHFESAVQQSRVTIASGGDLAALQFENSAGQAAASVAYDEVADLLRLSTASGGIGLRVTGSNDHVMVTAAGQVGIGTSVADPPAGPLEVREQQSAFSSVRFSTNAPMDIDRGGELLFGGRVSDSPVVVREDFGLIGGYKESSTRLDTRGYVEIRTNDGTGIRPRVRVASDGAVGIGTDAQGPLATLDVKSDYRCGGRTPPRFLLRDGSEGMSLLIDRRDCNPGADLVFESLVNGSTWAERMRIAESGNVGIGTPSPARTLHISRTTSNNEVLELTDQSGSCFAMPDVAGMSWSCTSDRRLKSEIRDAPPVLDELDSYRIRKFRNRSTQQEAVGVIAQEVAESHPARVTLASDGTLMVEEVRSWVLVKAIQELRAQNTALKRIVCEDHPAADLCKSEFAHAP
jgi:hypothetical protein